MAPTFIIAEAGVNHNGDLATAKLLVEAAAAAGADAVKFQTFRAERLVSAQADKAPYQQLLTGAAESQQEMLKRLELDEAAHKTLLAHCAEHGIMFISTPFDDDSLKLLVRLDIDIIKIPSGEITNHPFLRRLAQAGKPLILSTGMSTLAEVAEALDVLIAAGADQVTLLHCVTEYPAPVRQINLRAMLTMGQAFGTPVGYSDHSEGIEIAVAAVALGATVIEKHFTLDRSMPGPDHQASLEPTELKALVRAVRNVEQALGNGIKAPASCELDNLTVVRKGLVAARPMNAGDRLTPETVAIKRPGTGISPRDLENVLGLVVSRSIPADTPLTWEMLK